MVGVCGPTRSGSGCGRRSLVSIGGVAPSPARSFVGPSSAAANTSRSGPPRAGSSCCSPRANDRGTGPRPAGPDLPSGSQVPGRSGTTGGASTWHLRQGDLLRLRSERSPDAQGPPGLIDVVALPVADSWCASLGAARRREISPPQSITTIGQRSSTGGHPWRKTCMLRMRPSQGASTAQPGPRTREKGRK